MMRNRSMPEDVLIPVLGYQDIEEAIDWLTRVFGFTERWRAGNHRAQLGIGESAAIALTGVPAGNQPFRDHVMVRVDDVDAHYARVITEGGQPSDEPTTYPFGERQYEVRDFSGRSWVFTQSVADVSPEDWGGTTP